MTRTDEPLEPHESELRDLLERTMTGTTAPTEIGPQALQQGRRLRTRRRVGLAAGAVAASAAAALILPMALGGDTVSTTGTDPAGAPATSAVEPSPEPTTAELPEGWWSLPATDMVSAVEAILPDGITVTAPGPLTADTEEGGPAMGWINVYVTGPTGPGRLNVLLSPEPTADSTGATPDADISCPGNLLPRSECSELFAPDGVTVIGRESSTSFGGLTTLEFLLRRNGGTVYAAATNSLEDKPGVGSAVSADLPPLTLKQLRDLVTNDTWVMPAT